MTIAETKPTAGDDNRIERIRKRSGLISAVGAGAIALVIAAIELSQLSGGWLVPVGAVALFAAVNIAAQMP